MRPAASGQVATRPVGPLVGNRARLNLRVQSVAWQTDAIRVFGLCDPDGARLPAFEPGAHIDVLLRGDLRRSYSLVGSPSDRQRYEIAVYREPKSRGGSQSMHEVRVGDRLQVEAPANNFPLARDAKSAIFIAGGIGITPILSMLDESLRCALNFDLYYSAKTREGAAFLDRLAAYGDRIHLAFTREASSVRFDLQRIVATAPPRAHLYCCGPKSMIDTFEMAAAGRDPALVHVEHFTSSTAAATGGGYLVELARSGREIVVAPGKTILDALLEEGIDVPCSCQQGVCGTCETRILEGIAEHRDLVLSEQERAANKTMMICCSGAKSSKLILDL